MYHPGRVEEVISPKNAVSSDGSVQAVLEMWDENIITLMVDPKLAAKIKKGDYVLADYRPMDKTPAPRHLVIKIMKFDVGKRVWDSYKEFLQSKKENAARTSEPPSRRYIG